jgi:prophage regulatory protein
MANSGGSEPALPSYEGLVLLSYEDLKRIGINYSRAHLWRLEAAGKFPWRIYLSQQRVAWRASEVFQWLADRAAERAGRIYRVYD